MLVYLFLYICMSVYLSLAIGMHILLGDGMLYRFDLLVIKEQQYKGNNKQNRIIFGGKENEQLKHESLGHIYW